MADNTTLDTGTGGNVVRTVDHSSVHTPTTKLDIGGTSAELLLGDASASVPVAQDTSAILNGPTRLTPKFASFAVQTSGNNTLVAAVSGKKIRVLSLIAIGADVIAFESGADGTALTGDMDLASASAPLVLPFNPVGWLETASNTLLNMEIGTGGTDISGCLTYVEV